MTERNPFSELLPLVDANPGPAPLLTRADEDVLVAAVTLRHGSRNRRRVGWLVGAAITLGAASVAAALTSYWLDGKPASEKPILAPKTVIAADSGPIAGDANDITTQDATTTDITTASLEEPAPAQNPARTKRTRTASKAKRKHRAPEDLLKQANRARARRQWKQAAAIYRTVARRYAKSRTGYAALIAAASLDLEQLGNVRRALAGFRRAIARFPKGHLSQEAYYGIARAFKKLGNRRLERKALASFLRRFPRAPMAARAKLRLVKIGGER